MDRGDWQATVSGVTRIRHDWATNTFIDNKLNYILFARPIHCVCVCLCIYECMYIYVGFPGGTVVKNLPASAGDTGDTRDMGSVSGSRRYPGIGKGNPYQYSCLGNSMDRGAWPATVQEVTESQTWLSDWAHTHTHTCIYIYT